MYSIYMRDWLRLFPGKQFYILRLEDYTKNPLLYLKEVYSFLGMSKLSHSICDNSF